MEHINTIKDYHKAYNFCNLSLWIDKYLIPHENEKKQNAEVSTPSFLRKEMIDKIPDEFWKTPKKVFEPCSGKAGFLIDITDKFMEGLKEKFEDEEERYRVIVEECLYFSDINKQNIFIAKLLLDPYNKYKLNYNEGDTLKLDIKEKWGLEGFDVVIGNPPYQEVSEKGISKGGGNNLYTKFIYYADKICKNNGFILFITPPTFFGIGRSCNKNDTNVRKDIINKYYIHYINLEECSKHFNVGSKFIYYLLEKNNKINNEIKIICKYNKKVYESVINQNILINMEYLPYLLTNESIIILGKIKESKEEKLKIFNSPDNRCDKKHIKKIKNDIYKYPIQATGIQIVHSSKQCKNQYDKKVIMSESGYLKPFYDNGILGIGGHCFSCIVNNKDDGEYIIKLLNSKLYKFYIEINKWSGFHHKKVLQDLPYIKLEEYNEEEIYKLLSITKEEKEFIENII